jgi:hypothetical protein
MVAVISLKTSINFMLADYQTSGNKLSARLHEPQANHFDPDAVSMVVIHYGMKNRVMALSF